MKSKIDTTKDTFTATEMCSLLTTNRKLYVYTMLSEDFGQYVEAVKSKLYIFLYKEKGRPDELVIKARVNPKSIYIG